jgi:triosephosphate isomerase
VKEDNFFKEDSRPLINKKLEVALEAGLTVILCVGESVQMIETMTRLLLLSKSNYVKD